ncbi:hypothetical protein KY366_02135 [Candidatus Woesearchaeota archaeon]|nr:hypothetical protein [Candidatus Woesearchaeota archaeon]
MVEYEDLLKKGFNKKEARRTISIIERAKEKKSPKIKFFDSIIYWVLLIVAIIGNMVIAIILIPFLLAFKRIPLYFIIIVLAAMFGFLFDQLIRDIENLEDKHIIMAWVFIPALATINTYYMASFANHITEAFKLQLTFNSPIIVSIVYVIAFITPYAVHNLRGGSIRVLKGG